MIKNARHLIIAGVPRSGSTSLFTYLAQHPDVCGSDIKETQHFLGSSDGTDVRDLQQYMNHFKRYDNEKYLLEASPSYFFGGEQTAKVVFDHLGPVPIILLLREPISRLHSTFFVNKMVGKLDKEATFESFLNSSDKMIERGSPIQKGFYINYLMGWHVYFRDSLKILYFDDLNETPLTLMQNLCQWLQIEETYYTDYVFAKENRRMSYKNKQFHLTARYIHTTFEPFFRRNLWIKRAIRRVYFKLNESKDDLFSIEPATHKMLQETYNPYNIKLAEFLLEHQYPISGWLKKYLPVQKQANCTLATKVLQS